MIIHNIYTSGSRKYPAHYANKWSLEITTGSRVLQAKILFWNLALEISQWGRSGWGSFYRNLSTVNFYTCTMNIRFSAVLTVSESVTQVLGICKNNVHMI